MSISYIDEYIKRSLSALGLGEDQYTHEAVRVRLSEDSKDISLGSSVYILVGNTLDVPYYASIQIQSADNNFVTSKTAYENLEYRKYQVFKEYVSISVSNYGDTFEPFDMEFLKIIPKFERNHSGFHKEIKESPPPNSYSAEFELMINNLRSFVNTIKEVTNSFEELGKN